jgi:hypothetical protein
VWIRLTYGVLTILLVAFANLFAQDVAAPRHRGFTQDWSTSHILFTRDGLAQHPEILDRESRVRQQAERRWGTSNYYPALGTNADFSAANTSTGGRDWNVSLVKGHVAANMYPAKYSFDPSLPPNCSTDYVVFGITAAGTPSTAGGQANLIGFNNLYSGTVPNLCGTAPKVMFAYNTTTITGGKIITSPVLSEDGTKIAFVESVGNTQAIFHVLTFTAGQGTITSAALPTAMTSLTFSATSSCTDSSPWVDYESDTAYVGSDDGHIYKINGVFRATPALATVGWPILLSKNNHLSPPVLDSNLNFLMVGSGNGSLYEIDINNPTVTPNPPLAVGKAGAKTAGLLAAPLVDVTSGTTFVATGNDGSLGATLVQVNTATNRSITKVNIGLGSFGGTALYINQPAFDNDYYNDPATGSIRLCGTGTSDTTPYQYAFRFTKNIMNSVPSIMQQLLPSTAAQCTGWTEFYNNSDGTDYFFFGLTQDCTATGTAGGCVVDLTDTSTIHTATVNGGPSGIVVDNYSTLPQASSVYMTAEKSNIAYKYTQNGLN